jgi:emfourin
MRLSFSTDGGFAFMPGLRKPFVVDTAELPADVANELETLVGQAKTSTAPAGADQRSYRIEVGSGADAFTLEFTDPVTDPAAQRLVERLDTLKRET